MSGFEVAKRLAEDGQRLRFYQDFYGRQWIKVQGGWRFWRTRKIFLDNEEIVELIKRNTRRFSRKQMTWFRRFADIEWYDAEGAAPEDLAQRILSRLEEQPLNRETHS